jgi:hypothetical protein
MNITIGNLATRLVGVLFLLHNDFLAWTDVCMSCSLVRSNVKMFSL